MLKHKMLNMLRTMQKEKPEAFNNEKTFKALSHDLIKNDSRYNAIIRWICIAMFEHNAIFLLEQGVTSGDVFVKHNLAMKLVAEGVQRQTAVDVIGCLAMLVGYDDKAIDEFMNNKTYSGEPSLADGKIMFGGFHWKALDEENGFTLFLSEKVIERRAFNETSVDTDWGICTLNRYLNTDFRNNFNDEEKSLIVPRVVITEKNPWYNITTSNSSTSNIFLLSIEDVVKYFGDTGLLSSPPKKKLFIDDSDYNEHRIARDKNGQPIIWWLRSPGDTNRSAAVVMGGGQIAPSGFDVSNPQGGVRPAMWLKNK